MAKTKNADAVKLSKQKPSLASVPETPPLMRCKNCLIIESAHNEAWCKHLDLVILPLDDGCYGPEWVPISAIKVGQSCIDESDRVLTLIERDRGRVRTRDEITGELDYMTGTVMVKLLSTEDKEMKVMNQKSGTAKAKSEKAPAKKTTAKRETESLTVSVREGAPKYAVVRDATVKEKFLSLVTQGKPDECWKFNGPKSSNPNSGAIVVNGQELRVGKVAYLIEHPKADPEGRYVATCKNGFCANAQQHIKPAGEAKTTPKPQASSKRSKKEAPKPSTSLATKGGAKSSTKKSGAAKKSETAEPGRKTRGVDTSKLPFPKGGARRSAGGAVNRAEF